MIELVLTINDTDGSYTEHAGVVLASIFSNTQQTINVHIVHDDSLSEDNKAKLSQLVESFQHNIFYYHVTVPEDLREVAAGVHKIDFWTMASMYRLLLPLFIEADRVIYLDCDILVNMDINELWSIDLGERYLGAVLDQGQNLAEYFTSLGLSAELYFNSGVIVFQLNNIRNKQTWYEEMLQFLRAHPMMTMPDQDVLNAVYSSNYLQLDLRFNTFAQSELDVENKIIHFAGDNKWWHADSPAAPLYSKFLAMTPWAGEFTAGPVSFSEPGQANVPQQEQHPAMLPGPTAPAPEVAAPASEMAALALEVATPAPEHHSQKPHRRKRRRPLRLRRRLRLRLRLRLRKKRILRAKYRSSKRLKRIRRQYVKRKQALKSIRVKLRRLRKKRRSLGRRGKLKRTS